MAVDPSGARATQLCRHMRPAAKSVPLLVPAIWKNRSSDGSNAGPRAHGFAPLPQPDGACTSGFCEQARLNTCWAPLARSMTVTWPPPPWFEAYRYVWPFFAVAMVSSELDLPGPVVSGQPPPVTSVPSPTRTLCALPSLALR